MMIQVKEISKQEQLKIYKKELLALKENWTYFVDNKELLSRIDLDILCLTFLIEGLEEDV